MAEFDSDAFHIEQLVRPLVNLYRVSELRPDGTPGQAPGSSCSEPSK